MTPGPVKARRAFVGTWGALLLVVGCFWRGYPARLSTHTEVLVGIARKASDLVETGRFTAESLPELTYPLERGMAYARDARARTATPPPSLVVFEELLGRYRAYVDAVDRTRRERRGEEAAAALREPLAAVEAGAEAVRRALVHEARS